MPLPDAGPSRKSALDINAYPSGPDGMAALCRDRIAELEALKAKAARSERAGINRQLHTCRTLLKFATTRAGYTGELRTGLPET